MSLRKEDGDGQTDEDVEVLTQTCDPEMVSWLACLLCDILKMTKLKSESMYSKSSNLSCIRNPAQFIFECSHRTCKEPPWAALDAARFEDKPVKLQTFVKHMPCNAASGL